MVCIQRVDENFDIHDDAVELIQIPRTDSKTLTSAIKDCLIRLCLLISQCWGQAYDGASNMSGHLNGIATQIQKKFPAAMSVHCCVRSTNLWLQSVGWQCAPNRPVHICKKVYWIHISYTSVHPHWATDFNFIVISNQQCWYAHCSTMSMFVNLKGVCQCEFSRESSALVSAGYQEKISCEAVTISNNGSGVNRWGHQSSNNHVVFENIAKELEKFGFLKCGFSVAWKLILQYRKVRRLTFFKSATSQGKQLFPWLLMLTYAD